MKMYARNRFAPLALALALLLTPLAAATSATSAAAAAGGEVAGAVTDPKGAVVVGAVVTLVDAAGATVATATTDGQGRYVMPNVPPGAYAVVVRAGGFREARREQLKVEEGRRAAADFRLDVALADTSVTVTAAGAKANADPVYARLRGQGESPQDFAGEYAQVSGLVVKRDAATFTLRSGELYFLPAVEGRVTGAVFIGDGELSMTPPVEHEKRSLALFTGEPSITEQFTRLALRFTDKTFEEVKASPQAKMGQGGPQAARAREIFRDNQTLSRKELRTNVELRTLVDLYTPERPGFFTAFIGGRRYEKLIFQLNPLGIPEVSPEEVALASYGESDRGYWAAFHLAAEYAAGKASADEDRRIYDITHHVIDAAIRGSKLSANDTLTFRALVPGSRVLPLTLFPTLRVNRARDEQGRDLQFVQEGKSEDADFGVIWPEPLEAGKSYKLTVEYEGPDAVLEAGGGNYFVNPGARHSWYPNNEGSQFGDRATFDMTFRYPKGKTLVGTGAPAGPETREGDITVARWTSGETDLAVAGFNYGAFKRKAVADKDTGYQIEFYANESLPDFLKEAEDEGVGSLSTTGMADSALADAQNSTRIFNAFFGRLPYTRVAMTQQPASNFGQAWPTLVYMPLTAFMDSTQRWLLTGSSRSASNSFFRYVGPHEVAHQWWGHVIGWKSYRDQWMSEGFAEFSASLYAQAVDGPDKFVKFWEEQQQLITQARPATRDRRPYTVGAITQGYRLLSGKTGAAYQFLVYPKGAYVLHMLRMMMWDRKTGDARFVAMMQDFIKTHYNKDVSTEDFKRAVEKHMTPEMDLDGNGRMDWYFNQWVYGAEVPSYKMEYAINGDTVTGRITQSGVSDNFHMIIPIYVDMGKGWVRLASARLRGNATLDLGQIKLPQPPKRMALAANKDVLAVNIETQKTK